MFFPDRKLSVHAAQSIPIHSILKDSRKPVRKIPANVTLLLTIKPEIQICQPAVSCITKKERPVQSTGCIPGAFARTLSQTDISILMFL